MKKTHKTYLRRIIGTAASEKRDSKVTEAVTGVEASDSDLYRILRDIVCDARFYAVIENDKFWKDYASDRIERFIDSLPADSWRHEESRTMQKEDFLNDWFARHIIPLTMEEKKEIERSILLMELEDSSKGIPDPGDSDGTGLGIIYLGAGIKDKTQCGGAPEEGLPQHLKDYMNDMAGGNTPDIINEGHDADARFLSEIDASIKDLAEKIGRRGEEQVVRGGRFRYASRSDISGVTVGDDLNSLLPSEIALLSSPSSEKLFLDRFSKKRLQIFSSASLSRRNENVKKGPIYICIDTSGSMTGQPEELAKTLALAIAITAQKEKRDICILNYSGSISFFVLTNLNRQRLKLLRFLSESYGGGNDENKLFNFILHKMPNTEQYKKLTLRFNGADMLVISDFQWSRISEDNSQLIDNARKNGMRIFSVGIGLEGQVESRRHKEEANGYNSGFSFFDKSDFRYSFTEGRLKEESSEQ